MSAVSCHRPPQTSPGRIRSGSRPIGAGRLAALAALITLALAAGCGGADGGTPSSSSSAPENTSSAPSTETTTPHPADPGTPPSEPTVGPTDELPYDPVPRTVTGIVQRTGGCTVLVVGSVRWVLTGDLAASLNVGSRMTVTGNLTHRPSPCPGEDGPVLQATSATPA
jgi:hypothetical protein